jgi:(p)ppGpp synthase/HD superfamily hydrolase
MTAPQLTFLRDLPLARAATRFADERHAGQRRAADGASFVLHPLEVAALLERSHYPDHVVAAAVLHDVLEDTAVERAELESRFGSQVAQLVALVTDDPSIEEEDRRKDDVRERVRDAGGHAAVVYAADKISKVRELRALMTRGLEPGAAERTLRHHRKSLEMLEATIPGNRLVEVLRFEIEALETLPPEAASTTQRQPHSPQAG